MNDGQRKQQNEETHASASNTRHADQWEPRKRREDEINDCLKPEETEEMKGNEIKKNDTWITVGQKSRKMESNGKRIRKDSSRSIR